MKKTAFLLMAILLAATCFPQGYKTKRDVGKIMNAGACYWAESGDCKDMATAEEVSLTNLLNSIKTECHPQIAYFVGDSEKRKAQLDNVFETFKADVMKGSAVIVTSDEAGKVNVFRYLKKDYFAELCDNREELANYYYREGKKADYKENDENNPSPYDDYDTSIGDAIRYYCWSLMTCYAHPYGATLTVDNNTESSVLMKDWLYERINNLLEKINIIPMKKPVVNSKGCVVYELRVTDGVDRIPWLKFSYNNGNTDVDSSVESGVASVELVDKGINSFNVKICVDGRNEAEARGELVADYMNVIGSPICFESAVKSVNVKKARDAEEMKPAGEGQSVGNQADMEPYKKAMKAIEKAVRNKDIKQARQYFTEDGFEMFGKLLTGRYYVLGAPEYKFMEYDNLVICRSLPMQFSYKNSVGFFRNVVFRFDKDSAKVSSIAFRLSDVAELDILGKERWQNHSKMVLVNFLEDYQTAYALKRTDYLDKIFSDDALIIVGTVLSQRKKSDDFKMKQETRVRYDTLSKSKFIGNLDKVFNSNEFVTLRFLDTEFDRHSSGKEIYGIRVKQEYMSSTYGDVGYLFLIVDLRTDVPVIHVRTWEPDKTDEPIGFNNFTIKI